MEDRDEWMVVEPEEDASAMALTPEEKAKITAKNKKVKAHLFQCIPDDILMQVANKKMGKEAWDSLKARFIGADRVRDARLQTLKSEFDAMNMKEDDPLDQVVGKLTSLSVRSSSLGGSIGDADLIKKLFDIMPDRYLNVVAGIEMFYDLKTMAFDEVVGRLKAFEERTRRGKGAARTKGQYCSLRRSGRHDRRLWEASLLAGGRNLTEAAKDVVVVAETTVAAATVVTPARNTPRSVTKVMSSVSSAMGSGTMPIDVQGRRRKKGQPRRGQFC
jgi:hypothetical protein